MDRRTLLLAGTAGLVLPAFASTLVRAADSETTKLTPSTYEAHTLLIGTFSKTISEIASQKAHNPKLKEFAGFEIAEQTAIAEVLKNQLDPKPPSLDKTQQDMVEKLGNESGSTFDRAYVKAQIEGHEELRRIQDAYLEKDGFKSDHGHIAKLAQTVIVMHLALLHDLDKAIG